MKKTVLITGGAGFIGSHVTDYCTDKLGFKCIVLDDLSGGSKVNVNRKAVFIKGSIVDQKLVNSLFIQHKFSYVYHFAAYAAENLSHYIKRFNYLNNLVGSVNLINASVNNKVECFIFTSSCAVYGKNQLPMTESLIPVPEDSYGIAKLSVERELEISRKLFGLNYIVFRPHNVYGERQNISDKYRNVIGIFMNSILQEKELIIFGDGQQSRAFTYVGDITPIIASSVNRKKFYNEIFNIGTDKKYTVNELLQMVMKVMEKKTKIRNVKERNEVKHVYADHKKLKKYLGLKTENTPLEVGLKLMSLWVKKFGAHESAKFSAIEIRKNLPQSWN